MPLDEQPKPLKLDGGYLNPFDDPAQSYSLSLNAQMILERERESSDQPTKTFEVIGGPSTEVYQPQRKWKLSLSKAQTDKIAGYRERYGKYLEKHN